jgi:hypothetical protein
MDLYVSRLLFHTVPGKTREVEQELKKLRDMVGAAGGAHARILHTHFASLGAADAVFEQRRLTWQHSRDKLKSDREREFPDLEPPDVGVADSVAQARNLHHGRLNVAWATRCLGEAGAKAARRVVS